MKFSVQKKFRFKKRKSDKGNKIKEKFSDMVLNIIRISDIILEVLDARFIKETRSIDIENRIKNAGKKIIYVLNKADLVDIGKAKQNLPEDLRPYVFISCTTRRGIKDLRDRIKIEVKRIEDEKFKRKHIGIIGYPNTGKSSLINCITGRNAAPTSVTAGFTRAIRKIKLVEGILLIDTPGIIPQEEYDMEKIMKTGKYAKIGARNYAQVKEPEIEVYNLIKQYPGVIEKFYGFEQGIEFDDFIEQLGRKKYFIIKGNAVDEARTCRAILKDWQEGKIRIE